MKSRFSVRRALITNISLFLLFMGLPLWATAVENNAPSDDQPLQTSVSEQLSEVIQPVLSETDGSDKDNVSDSSVFETDDDVTLLSSDDETQGEPNADPDPLQPLVLEPGMPQERQITSEEEEHWFQFSLEENSDISLKIQNLSGQVQMWLYQGNEASVVLGYASTADGSDISVNSDTGTYWVKVSPPDTTTLPVRYILSLSVAVPATEDANDAPEQAAALGLNSPLISQLAGTDQDWFSFSLETQANVTIRTQAEADDLTLSLYRDGEFVKEIEGSQISESLFEISQELSDGTYFVKVSGEAGLQNSIPYTLEVVSAETDEDQLSAYEPNDNVENATPLIFGSVMNQAIAPATDTDWFVFTLESDSQVYVEARNMGLGINGDVALTLHYPDGSPVNTQSTLTDDGTGEATEVAKVTYSGAYSFIDASLSQGTYYVRAAGVGNGDQTLSYELTGTTGTDDTPTQSDDTVNEPNDDQDQAVPLAFDTPLTDNRMRDGDTDWFRFTLEAPTDLLLEVWGETDDLRCSGLRVTVFAQGETLSEAEANDADEGEPCFRLESTLPEGSYYVEVRGTSEEIYTIALLKPGITFERVREGRLEGRLADLYVDEAGPPAFADLDGDGDFDMLLGSVHGKVSYYRNDGTSSFASWTFMTEDFADIDRGRWSQIVPTLTDIDGDGDPDLFLLHGADVLFYENQGSARAGNWVLASEEYLSVAGYDLTAIRFTDIDGDGDSDLFLGGVAEQAETGWQIFFYRNTGTSANPSWQRSENSGIDTILPEAEALFDLADSDGDGDSDLWLCGEDGKVVHYENIGSAQAPAWTPLAETVLETDTGLAHLYFADMDSDGDPDLYLENTFYENQGSAGVPVFVLSEANYLHRLSYWWYALTDIDADGDLDLFASDEDVSGGFIRVYENNGTPATPSWHLTSARLAGFTSGSGWAVPSFADIDSDGDQDLFIGTGSETGGRLYFYRNTGTSRAAVWSPEQTDVVRTSGGPVIARFADTDGDGDPDMFVGAMDEQLRFYENTGTAAAPAWQLFSDDYLPGCGKWPVPDLWDADGDGDPDLFVGNAEGNIRYYRNDGPDDTGFPKWTLITPDYGGISCRYDGANPLFADPDSDGDRDLFVGTQGGLHLYKNASAHLSIAPASQTLTAGETILFEVSGNTGPVSWYLASAPSGGTIDPDTGLYTAGNTQESAKTYARTDGAVQIPDGLATGMSQTLHVADEITVSHLAVSIDISHPSRGDLILDLTAPSGKTVRLKEISEDSGEDIRCTYGDADGCTSQGDLSNFYGEEATGDWTLTLFDSQSGSAGTLNTWSLIFNGGNQPGVIDTVAVRDEAGMTGQVFVNVISQSEVSAAGKAIIVAGRRENDHVWEATRYMADFAYQTLKYRGFSDENIWYLSNSDEGEVTDGTGVDGPATLENLRYAFETFAAGASDLTVYFVDHGDLNDEGQVWFRVSPSEILMADTLDQWLDALQAGDCGVSVIVECCSAGSFLGWLTPPEGKERIVIASTGLRDPAYYIANGLISFSQSFFSSIYSGSDIMAAFETASAAMSRFQSPMMDDDGDGIFQTGEDGALARSQYVGAEYIGGADRPRIGRITTNLDIGSEISGSIWAEEVTATYPVTRVWAVVMPPGFAPDSDQPVDDLPEIELLYNEAAGRYEGTYEGFTASGVYSVTIFAQDVWNSVSDPKQMYVTRSGGDERVILVSGAGAYADADRQDATAYLARYTYQTLLNRRIDQGDIWYMAPEDTAGADTTPTWEHLRYALEEWAGEAEKLTLCFIGPGEPDGFRLNTSELVTPAALKALLDTFQANDTQEVCLIFDAACSGNWLPALVTGDSRQRLMIASTSAEEDALREAGGRLSFSQFFMNQIFMGQTVLDAFVSTTEATRFIRGIGGQHQLDDNGNGEPNEKPGDGDLAGETHIGPAFVTGNDLPQIGTTCGDTVLGAETSALIWAGDLSDADQVWASVIPPPDAPEAGDAISTVELTYNGESGRYETLYAGFTRTGVYTVLICAEDTENRVSEPVRLVFTRTGASGTISSDSHEDAEIIVPEYEGGTYDFQEAGEADWFRFYGIAGELYTIEANDLGEANDVVIELYAPDGKTLLAFQDTPLTPLADERLTWTCPGDGIYYVKVRHYNPETYGAGTAYTLKIYHPVGSFSGFLTGTVTDFSSGAPIGGAIIRTSSNGSDITRENGAYLIVHPAATFDLTVSASGYRTHTVSDIILEEGETKEVNVGLTLKENLVAAILSPDGDVTIDQGKAVSFQGSVTGGRTPFVFSWHFGGGAGNSDAEDPGDVVFAAAGIYEVTFTVTDADGDTAGDTRTVTVSAADSVPHSPVLSEPVADASDVPLTPQLVTQDFSHPAAGYAHDRTCWQISTASDFSAPVLDLTTTAHLTDLTVPVFVLEPDMTYYWRVRFYDNKNGASDWSETRSFATTAKDAEDLNQNGVPDVQEVADTVDLDGDGVPDAGQTDMKCVNTLAGNGQIGVKGISDGGAVVNLRSATSGAVPGDGPGDMPLGLIQFKLSLQDAGETVVVKIYFSEPAAEGAKWYKYDLIDGWQDYSEYAGFSTDRQSVTITLTDGDMGDGDGAANSVIIDPSGIVVENTGPPPSGDSGGGGCFISAGQF